MSPWELETNHSLLCVHILWDSRLCIDILNYSSFFLKQLRFNMMHVMYWMLNILYYLILVIIF